MKHAPVYWFTGDARALVQRAEEEVEGRVTPDLGVASLNRVVCRCGQEDATAALSAARMPPMMGRRRLVLLREVELLSAPAMTALAEYLQLPVQTTTLVVVGEKPPRLERSDAASAARWKELVERAGGQFSTYSSSSVQPVPFVLQCAARHGRTIEPAAAQLMVEWVGPVLDRLEREVEKVLLYAGTEAVTSSHVVAATSPLAEAIVWDLTGGVGSGDPDRALTALQRMLGEGEDPRRLASLLLWQVRDLLRARALVRQGKSDAEVRAVVKVRPEALRSARRWWDQWPGDERVLGWFAEANAKMNRTRAGADAVLITLVLKLLAPAG
jgi:DNA polymerase-3 subunit delta